VNAADFFANHPFHVRMAEFSRRLWAPARQGEQRETKWFYERARGQYLDAQSKLTAAEQKRFKAEYPKPQMFTKTDLAKFENAFDDHPRWVNLGSQKNFGRYAVRIGKEWERSSEGFNEFYFRRAIARGILFRSTEKLVSDQLWYNGGYRANIVAYTLAMLEEVTKRRKTSVNYSTIWATQALDDLLLEALSVISTAVNDDITQPPAGISNISEWCKREGCWSRLIDKAPEISATLAGEFWKSLTSAEDNQHEAKTARQNQKVEDGIGMQSQVIQIPPAQWSAILRKGALQGLFTQKEMDILKLAEQIPNKIPSEKQSAVLIEILGRAKEERLI
jgi:hypothetical protein